MLEDEDSNFDLLDHINDIVEHWTIREDGAMFVRLRMEDRAKDLYFADYVKRWNVNPLTRPYLYSAEMDDFTHCIYGSAEYLHPYGDPNECHHWADRKTEPQTCEDCKHWNDTEDGCADRHGCRATTEDCSTVPTSSKMEQVQPQTCSVNSRPYTDCCNCEHFRCTADEPQTERKER